MDLKKDYTPTIKMEKCVYKWFLEISETETELEGILGARLETPNILEDDYTEDVAKIRNVSDKTLALAWLYPERIEVI